jgi:hypothetical protein
LCFFLGEAVITQILLPNLPYWLTMHIIGDRKSHYGPVPQYPQKIAIVRPFLTVWQNKNKTAGRTNVSVLVLSDLLFLSPKFGTKTKLIVTYSNVEIIYFAQPCFRDMLCFQTNTSKWPFDFWHSESEIGMGGGGWVHTESGIRNVFVTVLFSWNLDKTETQFCRRWVIFLARQN